MIKALFTPFLVSGIALSSLHADVYTLKDGTTYEGSLSFKTEDTLYLLVEVKPGIRDEIAVKKSDIESISKTQKDTSSKDFEAIKKLVPTPDLLAESDYQRALENQIDPFLEKHKKSPNIKNVVRIKETLLTELELVKNGAIKIAGAFLSDEEQEHNTYEIDSILILHKLKSTREYTNANALFQEMEKNYRNTTSFKDAEKHLSSLLSKYERNAKSIISSAKELIEKRDKAIEAMTPSNRVRAKQALANEEKSYQAKLRKAQKEKSSLLPLNRFHPEIAKQSLNNIQREQSRLQRTSRHKFVDAGAMYRDTKEAFNQNNLDLVKEKLKELRRAKVPAKYLEPLQQQYELELIAQKEQTKQKRRELAKAKRKLKEQAAAERATVRTEAQNAAKVQREIENNEDSEESK